MKRHSVSNSWIPASAGMTSFAGMTSLAEMTSRSQMKKNTTLYILVLFLIFLFSDISLAGSLQTDPSQLDSTATDSLKTEMFSDEKLIADTLKADSLEIDTLETEKKIEDAEADTTLDYNAERIYFDVKKRTTTLTGNARIKYQESTLEAYKIVVDWDRDLMTATETYDTTYTDTTETEIDTIKTIGTPTFIEKNQTMTGRMMKVNMETKEGYIVDGRTKFEEGFYQGDEIQKVSDKILYIKEGCFTSCDHDPPHYGFSGTRMKMVYKDKVVGKPVLLQFGDVPVAAIPFGVFSIKPGRHSGIIVPNYGDDSRRGRHFTNLGYYFAYTDYWDARTTMDFYEKRGMLFRGDLKYNLRYKLNGGISGSFDNQNVAEGSGRKSDWDLRIIHNQDIDPTMKLRVNGTFVSSGNYYKDYSNNPAQRMNQKMNSNATLNKSWLGTGRNLSLNLSHQQNLVTDENSQALPNASMSFGTKQLFPSEEDKLAKERNVIYRPPEPRREPTFEEEEEETEPWFRTITYNYKTSLKNNRNETSEVLLRTIPLDTIGTTVRETVVRDTVMKERWGSGIQHSVSVNAPQKVAKYITVNPRFSYREDWFNERRLHAFDSEGKVYDVQERGFFQRRTFNTGVNTSTKLYGYFNINRANVKVIRHVITPSVGFTYRPDFSVGGDWEYYQELYDSTGQRSRHDRYKGSAFGGTPAGKQLAVSMSVNNLFQMKRVKLNQEGEEEDIKSDLFTYNVSTNYDFARDSLRWGNLRSSFRATPIGGKNKIGILQQLSIDLSAGHSLYRFRDYVDANGNERRSVVDQFYWDEPGHGIHVLRMTSFSANSSFTLSGRNPFTMEFGAARRPAPGKEKEIDELDESDIPTVGNEFDDRFEDPAFSRGVRGETPWRISGSLRYNLSMNDPQRANETLRLTGSASVNLTENWSFSYSSGVDLMTRRLTGSSLSIQRDLHCWQGSFSWSPVGYNQGFYLRIGIKASQLRDVKFEQRRGGGGTVPYFG